MSLELPRSKQEKIRNTIYKIQKRFSFKIRDFAHLLGLLNSACPAVPYGLLYTKRLETVKYIALRASNSDFNSHMRVSLEASEDLFWWYNHIVNVVGRPLGSQEYKCTIFSDSSKTGWGAVCQEKSAHGFWENKEQLEHINYLELLAAFFGLKCYAKNLRNCNILLKIDNTTAIAYINRMGGTRYKKLNLLARTIWQWCEKRKIYIFASYIASSQNFRADFESRRIKSELEWQLSDDAFNYITKKLGCPDIDLFASRLNAKCKKFVSWKRDPEAFAIDAFTISWRNQFFYAFPPFAIIPQVLQKIKLDKACGILVVPLWPSQPWYPIFLSLISHEQIVVKPNINLITSSDRLPHPLWKQITLVASLLSPEVFI